ncbi:MAG: hypothetical protein L0207_05460 [Chlamydiae bacterium]|nr:hypothetical protein [Chlamydiota bacterium]
MEGNSPYHVRPFPQQPKRGGVKLIASLEELEKWLSLEGSKPDELDAILTKIHSATQTMNDAKLVDLLRQLTLDLDQYKSNPQESIKEKILKDLTIIRKELKHL